MHHFSEPSIQSPITDHNEIKMFAKHHQAVERTLSPSKLNVAAFGTAYSVNKTLWITVGPSRCKCFHSTGPLSLARMTCKNRVPFCLVFVGMVMSMSLERKSNHLKHEQTTKSIDYFTQ